VAGGGGIIYSTDGITETRYAWGLVFTSNNQVEALALLQGLLLLNRKGVEEAWIIWDSQTFVGLMVKNSTPKSLNLQQVVTRIKAPASTFWHIAFFHVLWGKNYEAEKDANNVVLLRSSELKIEGEGPRWDPLPWTQHHVMRHPIDDGVLVYVHLSRMEFPSRTFHHTQFKVLMVFSFGVSSSHVSQLLPVWIGWAFYSGIKSFWWVTSIFVQLARWRQALL